MFNVNRVQTRVKEIPLFRYRPAPSEALFRACLHFFFHKVARYFFKM